jgi:hypothetical protein
MQDLAAYVAMLKETVAAVENGIRQNQTAEVIRQDPAISKYAKLGDGGGQTVAQYVDMLMKLVR